MYCGRGLYCSFLGQYSAALDEVQAQDVQAQRSQPRLPRLPAPPAFATTTPPQHCVHTLSIHIMSSCRSFSCPPPPKDISP